MPQRETVRRLCQTAVVAHQEVERTRLGVPPPDNGRRCCRWPPDLPMHSDLPVLARAEFTAVEQLFHRLRFGGLACQAEIAHLARGAAASFLHGLADA